MLRFIPGFIFAVATAVLLAASSVTVVPAAQEKLQWVAGAAAACMVFSAIAWIGCGRKDRARAAARLQADAARWAEQHYGDERREIAGRVAAIVVARLQVSFAQLNPATRFLADLEVDDLEGVELIMAWEEEFEVKISEAEGMTLETIEHAVSHIAAKKKA